MLVVARVAGKILLSIKRANFQFPTNFCDLRHRLEMGTLNDRSIQIRNIVLQMHQNAICNFLTTKRTK